MKLFVLSTFTAAFLFDVMKSNQLIQRRAFQEFVHWRHLFSLRAFRLMAASMIEGVSMRAVGHVAGVCFGIVFLL